MNLIVIFFYVNDKVNPWAQFFARPNLIRWFFFAENVTTEARTSTEATDESPTHSQSQSQQQQQPPSSQPQSTQQSSHQQQQAQQYRESQVSRTPQQPSTPDAIKPGWGYGLDLIGGQATAFWQNYQGKKNLLEWYKPANWITRHNSHRRFYQKFKTTFKAVFTYLIAP